jgi:hypothetical protein
MKKTIALILTILSALLILDSMDAFHALAMFMLAGIVPGTHIALSATFMLELFTLLLGFVLARIAINVSSRLRFVKRNDTLRP